MTWPVLSPRRHVFTVSNTEAPCLRLKTDQVGSPPNLIDYTSQWEANIPTLGPVHIVQPGSGAEGVWVKFLYDIRFFLLPGCINFACLYSEENPCDEEPPPCQEWQQFIVLKNWIAPFDGGDLTTSDLDWYYESEGSTAAQPLVIGLADDDEPDLEIQVDCSSGHCPPIFCESGFFTTPPPPTDPGEGTRTFPSFTGTGLEFGPPFAGPHFTKFLSWITAGGGSVHYATTWDVMIDDRKAWPKDVLPFGYVMYELVHDAGNPAAIEQILGNVSPSQGNGPSPTFEAISVFEDVAEAPNRSFILMDLKDTPSRVLPGMTLVNLVTGREVITLNPLNMIAWTSTEDAVPSDLFPIST